MSITSFAFLVCFSVSLVLYYAIPKKTQWIALLIFSGIFFCVSSGWSGMLYILVNILVTDKTARKISFYNERNRSKKAGRWLLFGLTVTVGMLAWMKYLNFFIYNWNLLMNMTGIRYFLTEVERTPPIGISFYTLTSVGYMLDVYWRSASAFSNPFKTALFVAYFPQLTSGPITRFSEVGESLFRGYDFDYDRVTCGMQRMLWGFFKKLVISARAAILVDEIYAHTDTYAGLYVWLAAFLFVLQLYTDFSGCMDIVLGVSEAYGITLPENFRTPFFSQSVQEFWQRWHITLGAWLKNYVLYPILKSALWAEMGERTRKRFGKKAAKRIPSYLGMFCVWLLVGLWHGGAWKYVLGMGVWFWLCIVAADLTQPYFREVEKRFSLDTENFGWRFFGSIRVFVLVAVGDMFFRLDGVSGTLAEMKNGLSVWNPWILWDKGRFVEMGLSFQDQNILVVSVILLFLVSALREKAGGARRWLRQQWIVFRWLVWFLLFFAVVIYGKYGTGYDAADFIYRGF